MPEAEPEARRIMATRQEGLRYMQEQLALVRSAIAAKMQERQDAAQAGRLTESSSASFEKELERLKDREIRLEEQWMELALQPCPTGAEAGHPGPPQGRNLVADILSSGLPSPSDYARADGWSDSAFAHLLPHLRMHRLTPAGDAGLQQLPVALLDPILAQAEEDCAHAATGAEDTGFARELSLSMSGSFASAADRAEEFRHLARAGLGIDLESLPAVRANTPTAGTASMSSGSHQAFLANLAVRLDIGTGRGDPRIENCAYAALLACSAQGQRVRELCRCPVLLLELAGPNLSLSGFAFGEHCCCDQLSHTVSLLWQPKSELMAGAARIVHAIRRAGLALQAYYTGIFQEAQQPSQGIDLQLEYPYPRACIPIGGGDSWRFTYLQRLSTYTFLARRDSTGERCFVKFCKGYSMDAHAAVAKAGYAAQLLGMTKLAGRWLMVVTKYLEGAHTWVRSKDRAADELRAAVAALHAAGFVHGDLRECNVLVMSGKVFLTDFEWAGREGEARYPLYMNRANIRWPDGAKDGSLITAEHDEWWRDDLLSTWSIT